MIQLRHTGLYVKDLQRESTFFQQVFHMHVLCENQKQDDVFSRDILGEAGGYLLITKLLTDQGKESHVDDMLELLQVVGEIPVAVEPAGPAYAAGRMHLAFGVDDMDDTVKHLQREGGQLLTAVHLMGNENRCCLALDPEGNVLEIIERSRIKTGK